MKRIIKQTSVFILCMGMFTGRSALADTVCQSLDLCMQSMPYSHTVCCSSSKSTTYSCPRCTTTDGSSVIFTATNGSETCTGVSRLQMASSGAGTYRILFTTTARYASGYSTCYTSYINEDYATMAGASCYKKDSSGNTYIPVN